MAPDGLQFPGRERLTPSIGVDPARVQEDHARWLERSRIAWDARAERWHARAEANAWRRTAVLSSIAFGMRCG